MGTWEQLDTELSVTNDTSALDELIEFCNSDSDFADLFEPAVRMAEGYKEAIEEGSKTGIHITAERLMSRESRYFLVIEFEFPIESAIAVPLLIYNLHK